jgi:hypothetical protein
MVKLTVVYVDGAKEHYNISESSNHFSTSMGFKRYKEIIEDGMLKLVIDGHQLVLIPIVNIRKVMVEDEEILQMKVEDYAGFMSAKVVEEDL